MLNFRYPELVIVVITLLALLCFFKRNAKAESFPISTSIYLDKITPSLRQKLRAPILLSLLLLSLILLLLAAIRPYRVTYLEKEEMQRSIFLALDVSRSMTARDFILEGFTVDRLTALKHVTKRFILATEQTRIGLVVFGSSAFLQSPLTNDRELTAELISSLQPGMAGDGTAIGDGLALAIKRISPLPAKSRAIILITDGVSNADKILPEQAALIAKDLKIKIHTIGIGSGNSASSSQLSLFHTPHLYEFDEKTLKMVANESGGQYFNASDTEALSSIYKKIAELEGIIEKNPPQEIIEDLFWYYAAFGAFFLLSYLVLERVYFRIISNSPTSNYY
jgi:Ca-activated chloride channel family protein